MRPIGILGGTFDPVHCAHLRLAIEMREALDLESVRLLPAHRPRLRDEPRATAALRLEMLHAATADVDGLEVDERELGRDGETYTVDSLEEMRAEAPQRPLVFLVGVDAFVRLLDWHRWRDLLELAHFGVAGRPGAELPTSGALADVIAPRQVDDSRMLSERPGGLVVLREITALDVSATRIRSLDAQGRSIRFLVPDTVIPILQRSTPYRHEQ